jgi:hypothetical protein
VEGYQVQSILEMLIATAGTLTGLWIVARAWTQRRGVGGTKEIGRLTESVDKMRQSMDQMRDELMDVSERLEFTERMLARLGEGGSPRQQLPP